MKKAHPPSLYELRRARGAQGVRHKGKKVISKAQDAGRRA